MTEAGLDAAARSLRAWLNRQQFSDLSTPEVTAFFTDSVADWATDQGYEAQREAKPPTATRQNRTGRLDLQLRHRSGKGRLISIEVDRGAKDTGPFHNDTAADFANALDDAEPEAREALIRDVLIRTIDATFS
ncbi:DUF4259 domain-containing protein [Streptomyces tagetis]|uniref:DUF4259 domain-containing protein n=1 Tax=Streptomyces tagetis TaxID=2820809 RepID=UPI00355797AC